MPAIISEIFIELHSVFRLNNLNMPIPLKKTVSKNIIKILGLFFLFTLFFLQSCDFLFGTKEDPVVDEIFIQGNIDPNMVQNSVGYVPVLPVWTGFKNPKDVFVGYDEMVYVVDDEGLKILDLTGKIHRTIPVYKASDVIQDRRIHTFVTGKVRINIGGQYRELACIYHLKNTALASGPEWVDTLIHPFCDVSRNNISFRAEDTLVEFTGLAVTYDNTLYVARKGKVNDLYSSARPDNTVLIFNKNGENISYAKGLNPVTPNLKSVIEPSAIAGFVGPPQKMYGVSTSYDFLLCQADQSINIEQRVLWIKQYVDPDAGVEYIENQALLNFDSEKADGFLYEPGKFIWPADVYVAPDQSGYIFVVDRKLNKLFQFTSNGFEGVIPPANSLSRKNIIVSFGKEGVGLFEFKNPTGVCYFKKVVYVADCGNNRILRYILSTDME